jgi:hypothetical protein
MLYGYDFTLNDASRIKNYKKSHNINEILLVIKDVELSFWKLECIVDYKITIPLNLFEKYSIRLIRKANENNIDMQVSKIANLLQLDENLIKDCLKDLEKIGMVCGVESDCITINEDDNSEYLQYENKFKKESRKEVYELTSKDIESKESYIQREFEKKHNDKKFLTFKILDERESKKDAKLLIYDNRFLLFTKQGINEENDLRLITEDMLHIEKTTLPDNIFCHYEEFLPLLRDMLSNNKDNLVVIGSKYIEKKNLDIFKATKNDGDIYILSKEIQGNNLSKNIRKRIFLSQKAIDSIEDFVWIGDRFFIKDQDFIIELNEIEFKKTIKNSLREYFLDEISKQAPHFNLKDFERLENKEKEIEKKISEFKFQTKKDFDEHIKKLNTEKNRLYGLNDKKTDKRREIIKKIEKLERENKVEELEKSYPTYLKNRDEIFEYKRRVEESEEEKNRLLGYQKELQELAQQRAKLFPKETKDNIDRFLRELKNIERLVI